MKTVLSNLQLRRNNAKALGSGKLAPLSRIAVLLLGIFVFSGLLFADPVGSQTFNWAGFAPMGTKIRITATDGKAADNIDFTIDVSGLDKNQAANNVLQQLKDAGAKASLNGTNSINIYDINNTKITKVDGGGAGNYTPFLGGTVKTQYVLPGQAWKASFLPNFDPNQGITIAGTLSFEVAGEQTLNTLLFQGETMSQVANAFDQTLVGAGYQGVGLDGTEVSFYTDSYDAPISNVASFSFDGGNLHLGLQLPSEAPEPSSLLLLGSGLLGIRGLLRKRIIT